ncbi:hypothetical protein ACKKBF_B03080 [Auxenochlorella protothecoides x Auxenochlorella symbiontica]
MTQGVEYLHALYQCRELSAAVVRFGGQKTLSNIERSIGAGLAAVQACLGATHYPDITSDLTQVADLVLQNVEVADFEFACAPCPLGIQVLDRLQEAVFGYASLKEAFMRCVHQASLSEARQARDLCVAALLDTLSVHNALSLLSLARSAGCAPLRRRALRLSTSHFSLVTSHDYAGLVTMSHAHLVELLSDDAVAVASEAEVFRALAAWIEADRDERAPDLLETFKACIRLAHLGSEDLTYVESHPVILADMRVHALIANAFLCRLVGAPLLSPFGYSLNKKPRVGVAAACRGRSGAAEGRRAEAEIEFSVLSPPGSPGGSVGADGAASPARAAGSKRGGASGPSPGRGGSRHQPLPASVFEAALCRMGRGARVDPQSLLLREAAAAAASLDVPSPSRPVSARGLAEPGQPSRARRAVGGCSGQPRPSRRSLFGKALAPIRPEDDVPSFGTLEDKSPSSVGQTSLPAAALGAGTHGLLVCGGAAAMEMLVSPTRRVGASVAGAAAQDGIAVASRRRLAY